MITTRYKLCSKCRKQTLHTLFAIQRKYSEVDFGVYGHFTKPKRKIHELRSKISDWLEKYENPRFIGIINLVNPITRKFWQCERCGRIKDWDLSERKLKHDSIRLEEVK